MYADGMGLGMFHPALDGKDNDLEGFHYYPKWKSGCNTS